MPGDYSVAEISNTNYGYTTKASGAATIASGTITHLGLGNPKNTGNLLINKEDTDSHKALEGISFKVKAPNGQYIIAHVGGPQSTLKGSNFLTDLSYTGDINAATTFITDANGTVGIYNLLIGVYSVQEFSVGTNYEYEIDNSYITWVTGNTSNQGSIATIEVTRQLSPNTTAGNQLAYQYSNPIKFQNRRKYIKLSGYVWEDDPNTKDTDSAKRDNVYTANSQDKRLQGIPVTLRKISDNTIANVYNVQTKQWHQGSTVTNAQGAYDFTYVLINDIPNLYIRFDYNGMGYENVDVKIDLQSANPENGNVQNGNKASEGSLRTDFNKKYETITYNSNKGTTQSGTGQAKNENTNTYLLQYDSANGESKLVYGGNKALYNYGYSGNESSRIPFTGVYDQYMITATTYNAYGGCLDKVRTPAQIRSGNIEEFKNLNLGLKKRLEADLSIIKDVDSAKVHINGQDHIYRYSDRFNTNLYYDEQGNNGYNMSPAVKFGQTSKYGTMSYTRALYASDIFYGVGDVYGKGEDVLDVKITYKIGISNKSNLYGVVNEVVDYYDTKYNEIKIGTEIENNGMIKAGTELSGNVEKSENSQYTKIRINTQKLEIKPYEQRFIYIVLTVNPTHIIDILGKTEQEIKLDNVLEITSYSMRDANKSPYAAIDKNSQPGNMNINDNSSNKTTFEDDTDKAPGMKLVLQEKRQITGTVFVDNPVGDEAKTAGLMSGEIRQGDGIYNSGADKGLENVIVTLKNSKGETAQVYNQTVGLVDEEGTPLSNENTENKWAKAIVKTNRNGEFTIEGLIPDDYTLVYTWGDKEHKVQNYKATIVEEKSYNAKGNKENQDIEWYKDEFKTKKNSGYEGVEWNNATNSEIRRSDAIDDYTKRKEIDAQSSLMINENAKVIDNYEGQIKINETDKPDLIKKMDSTTPVFKVGIEYNKETTCRDTNSPEYEYKTDNNGVVVIENGYAVKKPGRENHLKSIDFGIVERSKQALELNKVIKNAKIILANGNTLINAEINEDGELQPVNNTVLLPKSEGANAQLKFEIDNEILEGSTLRIEYALEVKNISEVEYSNENFYRYGSGHGINENDLVTLNANDVIDYLDNEISINEEENQIGDIIQKDKETLITDGLLDEQLKETLQEKIRIFDIKALSKDLKPIGGDEKTKISIPLITSRILANITTNEINIANSAEIIKVKKSGGSSIIVTTLGNYVPGAANNELDDSESPDVIILPPTGQNLNYTPIVLLSISVLGLLGIGIILIKKFLKK